MASLLYRMARGITRHPVLTIVIWAVVAVGLTDFVVVVGTDTTNDQSLPGTQGQDATNVPAADFPPTQKGTSPIVFKVSSGTVNS